MFRPSLRASLALVVSWGCGLGPAALRAQALPPGGGPAEARLEEISVVAAPAAATPAPGPSASAGYVGGVTGVGGALLAVDSASAGILTGAQVNNRPVTRPARCWRPSRA